MIRVAIAEEHHIPRWALRHTLATVPDLEVVGDAGTVADTVEMLRSIKPDVLVLDPTMPDHTGFDILGTIRNLEHGPLVVVLAPLDDATYAARAIAAGAHAYVSKSADPKQLIDAIEAVSRGEQVIPPGADKLLASEASELTHREFQVMEMLARGMTNREICVHLGISIKTVDTHRGHVLKKLRLRNNAELARFAVKRGYVTL